MKEKTPLNEGPEKLELGEIECCALAHAFAKNKDAVAQLLDADNKNLLKKSADVLVRSESISFPRNPIIDLFYNQIAKAELARLSGGAQGGFHCVHSEKEHQLALESVVEKTARQPFVKEN